MFHAAVRMLRRRGGRGTLCSPSLGRMNVLRKTTKSVLARLGISVTGVADGVRVVAPRGSHVAVEALDDGAWLVTRPEGSGRGVRVDALDGRSWVVQRRRGRGRAALQMGPKSLRTHLLVDRAAARSDMQLHQRSISNYLASEQIAWILRDLRINCVFDVGGNVGQFGRQLRESGYEGRIVSFEPLPHLAAKLRASAAEDPDWQVHQCGLGEEPGTAEMTVVDGAGTTSSLLEASDFGKQWNSRLTGVRREQVEIRTIADVFDEAVAGIDGLRPYLKMDTQGFDLPAFRGAGKRVDEFLGMQSELALVPLYDGMARMPEQLAAYESAGFEIAGMFPVTRDRSSLRVIEFDVLMVRADALGRP